MQERLIKQAMINAFHGPFKSTRHTGGSVFYDWLIKNGCLVRNDEDIKRYSKEARREHPESIGSVGIIIITKSKIVDKYFSELKQNGIDIKDYL